MNVHIHFHAVTAQRTSGWKDGGRAAPITSTPAAHRLRSFTAHAHASALNQTCVHARTHSDAHIPLYKTRTAPWDGPRTVGTQPAGMQTRRESCGQEDGQEWALIAPQSSEQLLMWSEPIHMHPQQFVASSCCRQLPKKMAYSSRPQACVQPGRGAQLGAGTPEALCISVQHEDARAGIVSVEAQLVVWLKTTHMRKSTQNAASKTPS